MNFEEFEKKIKEDLPSVLPDRLKDAKIESREVEKLQGASYKGITISPENEKIVPTINMSEIFQKYENGMPYEDALQRIVEIAENEKYRPLEVDASLLHDYSRLKETLAVQVVETERNREMLSKLPHTELEDMSLVYRFDLGTDKDGTQSIVITNHLLDVYGITAEQLHQDAMEIAPEGHPFSIKPMSIVMEEIWTNTAASQEKIDAVIEEMKNTPEMMYVASVRGGNLGAGVITYPDFMEKAAERLGGDFFVLPSSTHEVILVPDNGEYEVEALREMVGEVNQTQVSPEERLTDSVYHYDSRDKVFELSEKFEARQMERLEGREEKASVLKELGAKVKECAEHPTVRKSLDIGEGVTI